MHQVPKLGHSSHLRLHSSHSQGQGVGIHHDNTSIDDFIVHQHPGTQQHTALASFSSSSSLNNNNHQQAGGGGGNSNASSASSFNNSNNNASANNNFSNLNLASAAAAAANQNQFDNSSNGKPGSISPRPSRGVQNNNANRYQNQQQQQSQHQRAPSTQQQQVFRRSPSMPTSFGGGAGDENYDDSDDEKDNNNNYTPTSVDEQDEYALTQKNRNNNTNRSRRNSVSTANQNYYPKPSQYSFDLKSGLRPIRELYRIRPQSCYQLGNDGGSNGMSIPITAIAASSRGTNLAWGDASGRVFFLERGSTTTKSTKLSVQRGQYSSFSPVHGATCYNPYVDPLSSNEVKPAVTALAFLPELSPSTLLITANEKTPILWRLVKVPSLAPPIRSVDMIGSRQVGPLTIPEQPTSVLKEVRKFNVDHEYNIHSLCVIRDGTQFISADEVSVRLWNVEHEHRGLLLYSEQQQNNNSNSDTVGGDASEVINIVHTAPHAPHTLLVGLSGGQVRMSDLRCNLKISSTNTNNSNSSPVGSPYSPPSFSSGGTLQFSAHPPHRTCDGLYRAVASATIGCDLSLCGNYIAQRDVSCLHLFDVRKAGNVSSSFIDNNNSTTPPPPPCLVNRWVLQDHVAKQFGQLYQLGSLFEKVSVRFVGGSRIVTGGFGECLISVNPLDPCTENVDVTRILCEAQPQNVEVAVGEFGESNLTTSDEDVSRLYREARRAKCKMTSTGLLEPTTRFGYLSRGSYFNNPDSKKWQLPEDVNAISCFTADEVHQEQQHLADTNQEEWRRVTKLCVLPAPSWIGIDDTTTSSSKVDDDDDELEEDEEVKRSRREAKRRNVGEVLATCGDCVYHVGVPLI